MTLVVGVVVDKRYRIIHVGNFPTGMSDVPYSSPENKITNGLVRLGHNVLNFSEREIARNKTPFGHRKLGRRATNRALVDFCNKIRPDILLLSHANMINAQTLPQIKRVLPTLKIGQFCGDWLARPGICAQIKEKQSIVDATFLSSCGGVEVSYLRRFGKIYYVANPTDLSIETGRADQYEELPYDLFMDAGNPSDKRMICHKEISMQDFSEYLQKNLPDCRIKRVGGGIWKPHIIDAGYHELAGKSAIGLNISVATNEYLYSSDRIAKLAGDGCLVAIERSSGFNKVFSEDEMLFFSSWSELLEKITYFKHHPKDRMRVASQGREKYLRLFNEKRVAGFMLSTLLGKNGGRNLLDE